MECRANAQYERYRVDARDSRGRRLGARPKPFVPPTTPVGTINVADPDSRLLRAPRGFVQGYNAQLVTNENQIVIAAEVTVDTGDFGYLEPMVKAAERELAAAGVKDTPSAALADAGYWHKEQMQHIINRGTQVLIPPESPKRKTAPAGLAGWPVRPHATSTSHRLRRRPLPQTPSDGRARVRTNQVQSQDGPVPRTRALRRPDRMATHQRHTQPPEAPQTPAGARPRLTPAPGPIRIDTTPAPKPRKPRRPAFTRHPAKAKEASADPQFEAIAIRPYVRAAVGSDRLAGRGIRARICKDPP